MREFVGIELGREVTPNETTVCKFRLLLEQHEMGQRLFEKVGRHVQPNVLKVSTGTIDEERQSSVRDGRAGESVHGAPPSVATSAEKVRLMNAKSTEMVGERTFAKVFSGQFEHSRQNVHASFSFVVTFSTFLNTVRCDNQSPHEMSNKPFKYGMFKWFCKPIQLVPPFNR